MDVDNGGHDVDPSPGEPGDALNDERDLLGGDGFDCPDAARTLHEHPAAGHDHDLVDVFGIHVALQWSEADGRCD